MTRIVKVKNIVIGKGIPKICVPMVGTTRQELEQEAQAIVEAGADLAEWRADFYESILHLPDVKDMLQSLVKILGDKPLLFTIRTAKEGGNLKIDPGDYENILEEVSGFGLADLIDVEVVGNEKRRQKLISAIHENGCKVIASSHNFDFTPDRNELLEIIKTLDEAGGDILKVAVMPNTLFDVWKLLDITNDITVEYTEKPVVTMSMGSMGGLSRFSGEIFGSSITFGVVGKASAPGQIPIQELRDMMNLFHDKVCGPQ